MSTRKQVNQNAIEASNDSHEISEKEMFEIEQNEYLDNYCQDDIFDLDNWDCGFIPF